MYLFLVGHYFYQRNHEKLKLLNTQRRLSVKGNVAFCLSLLRNFKVIYQELVYPHGSPGSNKDTNIEEQNYTLLDLARKGCCQITLSNLRWSRFLYVYLATH